MKKNKILNVKLALLKYTLEKYNTDLKKFIIVLK